jgi:hypothetical protein
MRNTTTAQPSLVEALREAQKLHVSIIIPDRRGIKLWAPGVPIPVWITNELRSNRKAIKQLRAEANVLTCCAAYYHRPQWRYAGQGVYVCDVCARLDYWQGQASAEQSRRTA